MTEEILEEWEAGEFGVQKCELGIGNVHYHVFSDNLNGKQIAERLEKHIDKMAEERGWEKEEHLFSVDWRDISRKRSQVGIYCPKRWNYSYRLHVNIMDRAFKERDLQDILVEITKERDRHRKIKYAT